jgi:2-oxoglutarate ferredoxin oxidoreductase subunit delta
MTATIEAPRIVILEDLCKGCGICLDFCPAKILKTSSRMTKKGTFAPEVTDPSKCTACRICQYYCPDLAIFITGGPRDSPS